MENHLIGNIISALNALGTIFGAIFIFKQLRDNEKVYQSTQDVNQSTFENDIVKRFYKISNDISFKVMFLNKDNDESEFIKLINDKIDFFYQYFDLTNQEIFLKDKKRINPDTWKEWEEGIIWIMELPTFKYAWKIVNNKCNEDTFKQLRAFIKEKGIILNI